MKDLEGRKALIQVGSGEVFEIDSPKYSDEGAMLLIPHAEGEKEQWTQCSLVSVIKVAGPDGEYPAEPKVGEGESGKVGGETELVAALKEALANKGEDGETVKALREEVEGLKAMVARLSKPAGEKVSGGESGKVGGGTPGEPPKGGTPSGDGKGK